MAFQMTSEQAKALRAKLTAKQAVQPFDKRAWNRAWMQRERARRRAVGVCQRCGQHIVEKFTDCAECREKASRKWRERA